MVDKTAGTEVLGCKYCPMSVTSYNCLRENGACFIIGCDAGNWFGARYLCREMNGSLVFAENETSAQGTKKIIGKLGIRSCDSFWLGSRHSDWFIDRGEGRTLLYRSLWYDDQPESVSTKDCAYLYKFFKGIYLYSSACDEEYPFFCERAMNMPPAEEFDVLTRQPSGDHTNTELLSTKGTFGFTDVNGIHHSIMTGGIVCLVLGLLCLAACIYIILAKRKIITHNRDGKQAVDTDPELKQMSNNPDGQEAADSDQEELTTMAENSSWAKRD